MKLSWRICITRDSRGNGYRVEMGLHVKWVLGGVFLITNTLATDLHCNNGILPRVRKSLDHRQVRSWDKTNSFLDTSVNLLCSITNFAWQQLGETLKCYPHDASYALMISSSSSLFLIFMLLVPTKKCSDTNFLS